MFEREKKLVMCQACRALVDPGEKTCPMCGEPSVPEQRLSNVAGGQFISLLILSVNVILFVLMGIAAVRNGGGAEAFFSSPASALLYDFGGFNVVLFKSGEWWRLVTCNFLHIGFMHLLFNSFALIQIGPIVEEFYGSQKFIFIYLATGIVSSIASYQFGISGAGASGAIFGLIGLMAVYGYRQGGEWGRNLMRQMLIWAAMGIVFGFIIRANNVAHIGGFIGGAVLGFVLKGDAPQTVRTATRWNIVALASIVIIAVSFVFVAKSYGSLQEQSRKAEIERNKQTLGAENIIALSRLIQESGDTLLGLTYGISDDELTRRTAKLKEMATKISNIPRIDEESADIRGQFVALLNQAIETVEKWRKNPTTKRSKLLPNAAQSILSDTEIAAGTKLFERYGSWEKSVINDYGLEYTKPITSK